MATHRFANLKMAIEIVDLLSNSMVDLSSSLWDSLPEANYYIKSKLYYMGKLYYK
jgi:hypothetical protein